MGKKLIIQACLCGAGTTKKQNPHVPITPDEIAADVVNCAKAGAAIAHIHVRDKDGVNCMDTDVFKEACDKSRELLAKENLDIILNLTTSGSKFSDELRLGQLPVCMPEMCSYDPGTLNWGYKSVFLNTPAFLEKLGTYSQELNIKPEVEVFDAGMMGAVDYYVKNGYLKEPVHYQFVLGVAGGMDGDAESLGYLLPKMRAGSTWSITGIGRWHMPCMLLGLAQGCDGLRVGLEDNIMFDKGVLATNAQLVERAVKLGELSNRSIATAQEAREILGLTKHVQF
jgi:3-keto-5-aminohexanoate cleavage enzyme